MCSSGRYPLCCARNSTRLRPWLARRWVLSAVYWLSPPVWPPDSAQPYASDFGPWRFDEVGNSRPRRPPVPDASPWRVHHAPPASPLPTPSPQSDPPPTYHEGNHALPLRSRLHHVGNKARIRAEGDQPTVERRTDPQLKKPERL